MRDLIEPADLIRMFSRILNAYIVTCPPYLLDRNRSRKRWVATQVKLCRNHRQNVLGTLRHAWPQASPAPPAHTQLLVGNRNNPAGHTALRQMLSSAICSVVAVQVAKHRLPLDRASPAHHAFHQNTPLSPASGSRPHRPLPATRRHAIRCTFTADDSSAGFVVANSLPSTFRPAKAACCAFAHCPGNFFIVRRSAPCSSRPAHANHQL